MSKTKQFGLALVALLGIGTAAGCSGSAGSNDGSVDDGKGGSGGEGGEGGEGNRPSACNGIQGGGWAPIVRLTNRQYRNAVKDLFPGLSLPEVALPSEPVFHGLDNDANTQAPTPQFIEAYEKAANNIADAVLKSPGQLTTALGVNCSLTAAPSTCGPALVEALAARAFRRKPESAELSRLKTFFATSQQGADATTALRATLSRVLQSPQFLYRVEVGEAVEGHEDLRKLNSKEMAARLSLLLWESLPDAELTALADDGKLQDTDTLEAQVERLLQSPRSSKAMASFTQQWLGFSRLEKTSKDTKLFPNFNDQLKADLRASLEAYVEAVLNPKTGNMRRLLTDRRAFVNGNLAPLYGLSGITGANLREVELDKAQRSGLLTQAALLAALAKPQIDSPVLRGIYVRENLLCSPIPPPVGIDTTLPEPKPGEAPRTTRQLFEVSHGRPECASCHRYIDGIGFGFSHYDSLGRYRDRENDLLVDAGGELVDVSADLDGRFEGAVELSSRVAQSEAFAACLATNFFRFSLNRAETDADECARNQLTQSLMQSEGDMKSMIVALVKSDAFRYRRTAP